MDRLQTIITAVRHAAWTLLRRRSPGYWFTAAFILVLSIWVTPYVDDYFRVVDLRYWLFQHLNQSATNPALPRLVKLVMIRDDEFFGSELAHRTPTNRAYLAKVVKALDRADASVIAVDIDLRLPDQDIVAQPGDYARIEDAYRAETETLITAIDEVARNRPVVMTRNVVWGETAIAWEPTRWSPTGYVCVRAPTADGTIPAPTDFRLPATQAKTFSAAMSAFRSTCAWSRRRSASARKEKWILSPMRSCARTTGSIRRRWATMNIRPTYRRTCRDQWNFVISAHDL